MSMNEFFFRMIEFYLQLSLNTARVSKVKVTIKTNLKIKQFDAGLITLKISFHILNNESSLFICLCFCIRFRNQVGLCCVSSR